MVQPEHLEVRPLNDKARRALLDAIPALKVMPVGDSVYQIHRDPARLEYVCSPFIAVFISQVLFSDPCLAIPADPSQRVDVLLYRALQTFNLLVPRPIIVVPVETGAGGLVAETRVEVGQCIHLTKDAIIRPNITFLHLEPK
jgi:hypothetical protein